MPWEKLGRLTLSREWQLLDTAIIEGEVFRIQQSYDEYPISFAWLSFVYANGGRYGYRKFYPSDNQDILITMPVPQLLIDKGLTVRYPTLKISGRTRIDPVNWRVSVDVDNFENSPVSDSPPLDGGTF